MRREYRKIIIEGVEKYYKTYKHREIINQEPKRNEIYIFREKRNVAIVKVDNTDDVFICEVLKIEKPENPEIQIKKDNETVVVAAQSNGKWKYKIIISANKLIGNEAI